MQSMVNSQQKKNLDYFLNKVCTIITPPINREFPEKILIDYFVGKITKIDDNGIWFEHTSSKCLNFVFYDKIISIAEEKLVDVKKEPSLPAIFTTEQLRKETTAPTDIDALNDLLSES